MSSAKTRRSFLKSSMLFGGGTAFAVTSRQESSAGEARSNSATYPNETLRTIQNLRTIHGNFSDRDVPDEMIELVLQSSIRAANASNMQTAQAIRIRGPAEGIGRNDPPLQ